MMSGAGGAAAGGGESFDGPPPRQAPEVDGQLAKQVHVIAGVLLATMVGLIAYMR